VRVARLELTDFRCYERTELELPAGVTVVTGGNGEGKTSLLEAIGWAALGRSFRGVPDAVLVRQPAETAILRVEIEAADARTNLVEAELRAVGRNRVLLDHHPLTRTRDLAGALRVTVFAPDDLVLVKGSPSARREYLDDLLVASSPRYAATRSEYDRVLRHRNALLKGGVRDEEARTTLEVFDDQLVTAGSDLVVGRLRLVDQLAPLVEHAYRALARADDRVGAVYVAEWAAGVAPAPEAVPQLLRDALADRRRQELDRRLTLVGPHRDEWRLEVNGLGSRTHASQGEQRTLALALRLAGHHLVTDVVGEAPVLLLDDVFSELDPGRAAALVAELPAGQTIVTSASGIPESVQPERRLRVAAGEVVTG
jgi:DNA replication and repair protein RecF